MGRKKKETNINLVKSANEQEIVEKETPTTLSMTASVGNINYNGSITVSIVRGNKKIKTLNFHNAGAINLFKFLGICFTGNYLNAEPFRPVKIKLFYSDTTLAEAKADPMNPIHTFEASDFKLINESVYTEDTTSPDGKNVSWSSTCHFRIPYAWIKNVEKVNFACLYGKEVAINEDYSAIYFFTKLNEHGEEDWDSIDIKETGSSNYNLIIDWKLTVTNQSTN